MYHAVSEGWNDPLAVRPAHFDRQLAMLVGRGFRGVPASGILDAPGDPARLHVTFDDAYASVRNALPTLTRLRLPATVFVCSDLAAAGAPLAIEELDRVADRDELRTLSWHELRELRETGLIEVGSHTKSHAHLPLLSDAELDRELRESREAIEENLGAPVAFIAYPFGEEDARVRRAASRAGYSGGFAAPGTSLRADPFRLPRTGLWRDEAVDREFRKTTFSFRLVAETSYPLRRYLRRRAA